jgi:hypothetical protein
MLSNGCAAIQVAKQYSRLTRANNALEFHYARTRYNHESMTLITAKNASNYTAKNLQASQPSNCS